MNEYLTQRITRDATASQVVINKWLRLEQIIPPETTQFASLKELYEAWMHSVSGRSARQIRPAGCPVEFDGTIIRFYLGFYVWTSDPNMPYKLVTNVGKIGPAQRVSDSREFSLFANNVIGVPLPYYMDAPGVAWESPVYNRLGEHIDHPAITNNHTNLIFSHESFGALRVIGSAIGNYHVLTVEVDKKNSNVPAINPEQPSDNSTYYLNDLPLPPNVNKIENLAPTIQAYWESGEADSKVDTSKKTDNQSMRLTVPKCVQDVLTACPGTEGGGYVTNWCQETDDRIVYYSTCDGSVLDVRDGSNPRRYCSRTALNSDPGPWLKRGL